MHRPLLVQVILDTLGSLRAAVERAEDDWTRAASSVDRDTWWPHAEQTARDRPRAGRSARPWSALSPGNHREDGLG